ncbi:MAG: H-type lectin domain-containing protein [Treponema sp.]|jgi:hypothetical protein|nr:H-type lectin domain-containing protein [Treponema sp.]
MANLPESATWEGGIFQLETTTFATGGPEGPANTQARQLANRTQWLKKIADEMVAARGGKVSLDERLDQYDAFEPENIAALHIFAAMGIDMAGLANREIKKTILQRFQSGLSVITNRGVISGCAVTKSVSAVRNLSLTAGSFFINGLELPCPAFQNTALVPANYGDMAQTCYAYIYLDAGNAVKFACTPLGGSVPEGGLPLYRFTVPAGNTETNDPYLGSVTMTDVRRVEAGYPVQFNSIPYVSVVLPYNMLDSDYEVVIDILSFKGGGNQRPSVYTGDKAANGFKLYAEGSLDAVNVRWTAIKLTL